ncbi:type II toxin-antitoxin system Phd/YefM family antitoxin [Agrococcus sp. KRD186]|jgi:prevent-host-death family protein|uniref:type II toxin-antitoxin system Phd/YefM family antitoxin n=1 Tax=Agrococcus sp. KRD186 TaxID=2729730 RepID=UPI0019D1BEB8|nr:type II toxin-antitoxin system Phd/YefM family antitoxin [Agrococcus sp. KRD186]
MKTITVGELRQNPTAMLADVEAGETYRITRHNHEVGRIVPPQPGVALVPSKHRGAIRLPKLPAGYTAPTGAALDELLDDMRGER